MRETFGYQSNSGYWRMITTMNAIDSIELKAGEVLKQVRLGQGIKQKIDDTLDSVIKSLKIALEAR